MGLGSEQGSHRRSLAVVAFVLLLTAVLLLGATASASTSQRHRHVIRHRRQVRRPCANANVPATSASVQAMRAAVVCLVNQQRAMRGLSGLRTSAQLNDSAQNWTNVMVASDNFTHGLNFAARISAVGYNWQWAGENIATGYLTPRQVVSAWMASKDHCRNILDPHFRDVGTGESPRPVSRWASGPATWTQDFGLLMSSSPPSGNSRPANGCPYR